MGSWQEVQHIYAGGGLKEAEKKKPYKPYKMSYKDKDTVYGLKAGTSPHKAVRL